MRNYLKKGVGSKGFPTKLSILSCAELHNGLEGTVVFDGRPEKIQAAKLRLVGRNPFCQFTSVMQGDFFFEYLKNTRLGATHQASLFAILDANLQPFQACPCPCDLSNPVEVALKHLRVIGQSTNGGNGADAGWILSWFRTELL